VLRSTPLRCLPSEEGIYERAWDLAFDVGQCAQLRWGEPVRVVARGPTLWYVWSTYMDGWVRPDALTPPLSAEQARSYLEPERFIISQRERLPVWGAAGERMLGTANFGVKLPLVEDASGGLRVLAPAPSGLASGSIRLGLPANGAREVSLGYPPLTRRNLLERAFRLLNTPYGWGGVGDQRDCSRLMMDLFAGFGLQLPRNTWHQSQSGNRRVEVGQLDEAAKAKAIESVAEGSVVLLYMPGHIMLYLGRDGEHLHAFHLFSGYLVPCPGGGETMQRVNRTVVTALDLGLGGSRRSFLQRITRLVLLGGREGANGTGAVAGVTSPEGAPRR